MVETEVETVQCTEGLGKLLFHATLPFPGRTLFSWEFPLGADQCQWAVGLDDASKMKLSSFPFCVVIFTCLGSTPLLK